MSPMIFMAAIMPVSGSAAVALMLSDATRNVPSSWRSRQTSRVLLDQTSMYVIGFGIYLDLRLNGIVRVVVIRFTWTRLAVFVGLAAA